MAVAVGGNDAAKYAENLRKQLMNDLFEGDDLETDVTPLGESVSLADFLGEGASGVISLQDVDKDLEEFQDHDVIKGILEQGRVVKEYAREIDDKLRTVELESIQDYIQESDNMVALHDQIKTCDSILSGMEQLLARFQSELGKVGEEIRQLQVQSQSMGTKLKNRRAAESQLGSFIEQLTISEELVTSILEHEVNEEFVEPLLALDRKLLFVRDDGVARSSLAKRDIEGALEKLRVKAVTKVREFMMGKVYQLKRPKTNVQIIQQSVLLKYKYFMRFLRVHGPDVYTEIRNEYVSVLSRILASHFRTYQSAMEKMQAAVAGSADVLGAPEGGGGGAGITALFGKAAARATTEATFSLGERAAVLDQLDKPAIIPHQAEHDGQKFPYEVIFRNVHKLLLDTATSEYLFCCDFFDEDEGLPVFKDMFAPIVAVVEGDLVANLQNIGDLICILLMIRINHDHRKLMLRRRVPSLDDYLDRVHLLLWPRFKLLFDGQLQSIRPGVERSLFVDSSAPHFVTRRYAALSSSMLVLMAGYDSGDPGIFKAQSFVDMMERLWQSMHDLLLRMSNLFKDRRTGIIFLIVQYNHIHITLRAAAAGSVGGAAIASSGSQPLPGGGSSGVAPAVAAGGGGAAGGPAAGAAGAAAGPAGSVPGGAAASVGIGRTGLTNLKECEDQLASCTGLFVDDQLAVHFRELVDWVKKAEQAAKRSGVPEGQHLPGFAPAQAAPILRDFAARWKDAIECMHREVAAQFAETSCGRDVLQASMTSLLKYYTRFLELLKRQGADGLTLVREAVNVPSIMYEIKRITKT
ncbi:hypothetical protein PLESTB_000222700 [Pleodorina starrii]|uniref:Vacuolar protein sorting-associated protein 52 A n=1 Tax=Pleodorina starrii TaxID=330485 RepID=A0A9W6BC82_9CHLO|nr:hypothetical protein PLESTM_001548600 [Pleodorina starrii]GLC49472.1 hypothetical protein PLESTB_000222700 [Pleodorina starrii]GLC75709.1 hypothetical protein PLESTF_001676100 [Pleodorina starrii]